MILTRFESSKNFFPNPKDEYKWYKYSVRSLMGIKHSFSWSFSCEHGRKDLLSRTDKSVVAGIFCRNHHFAYVPVEACHKSFPVLEEVDGVMAAASGADDSGMD